MVTDWNKTAGKPMAFGRSVDRRSDGGVVSTDTGFLLLLVVMTRTTRHHDKKTVQELALSRCVSLERDQASACAHGKAPGYAHELSSGRIPLCAEPEEEAPHPFQVSLAV